MLRILVICCIGLLYSTQTPALPAQAQARDPRVDQLTKDTEQLKHTVADQEKRIAELETTVKMLQAQSAPPAPPPPAPIPNPTPPWASPTSWNRVKPGMSQADVEQILGAPTSVTSVEDSRTLYYQPGSSSASTLSGTVTLQDDRVTAMAPPAF